MKTSIKIQFSTQCVLTEGELRALDALAGYGFKEFVDCFYKHMGEHYLKPYEEDLRGLFEKIKSMREDVNAINDMRKKISRPL